MLLRVEFFLLAVALPATRGGGGGGSRRGVRVVLVLSQTATNTGLVGRRSFFNSHLFKRAFACQVLA
jgi:hypothetical protein